MKLVAAWCRENRGFGIGMLVGALTIGAALPHLLNAFPEFGGMPPWREVLMLASGLALAGAAPIGAFRPGTSGASPAGPWNRGAPVRPWPARQSGSASGR
jgi:hypothetical protein